MTYNSFVFFRSRPWHTSLNYQSKEVTSFSWLIATCFLTAIQYGFFDGESVSVWSLVLLSFVFSLRAYYFGDYSKSKIINHEF